MARWVYQGDVNLEQGGVFFRIEPKEFDNHHYCDAVRVTPCSDAGGPDNVWWVEALTIVIPDDQKRLAGILDTCGYTLDGLKEMKPSARRQMIADACIVYGSYDSTDTETVQIGPDEESRETMEPTDKLRSNASLDRYVRKFLRRV